MTPREFYNLTGPPNVTTLPLVGGSPLRIREDWDRYLLAIFANDLTDVFVDNGLGGTLARYAIQSTTPILWTHALYGALVNLPYRLETTALNVEVTIVEGFLTGRSGPASGQRGPSYESLLEELRRIGGGNIRADPRPQPPETSANYLSPKRRRR